MTGRAASVVVASLAVLAGVLGWTASLRQSATFDEIVLVSGGARAVAHGEWDMISDQPPLPLWLYGIAVSTGDFTLPAEDREWGFESRWDYARAFHFEVGNDPEAVLRRARVVSAAAATGAVAAAGGYAWWIAGPLAGTLGAMMAGFLPDVLAHGGVAYNDLPLALFFVLSVWALDAAVRRPTVARGALVGGLVAATFGMKLSALSLVPIAVLLVAVQAWTRRRPDPGAPPEESTPLGGWARELVPCVAVSLLTAYALFVVLYRGDPTLTLLRFNFWRTVAQTAGAFDTPAYLLGESRTGGWWYYFPVVFFFKTPAAFQAALLAGVGTLAVGGGRIAAVADWRGRGALIGAAVFLAFLVRSDINTGFRYALPVLPLLCVIAAAGLSRLATAGRAAGAVVVALVGLQALTVLSFHPHYLAYSSVWAGGRDRAWTVVADSNLDWGQGLLELRDFMSREGIGSVRLSYFGSARPEAYGIDYVALPSFFRLVDERTAGADVEPRFTVISATNLVGLHLQGYDPYAAYRDRRPYAVVGHSMLVYDDGG